MRALSAIACVLMYGPLVGACVDLSPLPYEAPEAGPAVNYDASGDVVYDVGGPDAPTAACTQCVKTACPAAASACDKNAKCAKFAACMSAMQCWGSSLTDTNNLPACLVNCAVSASVLGQTDPVSALIAPVINCAQDPTTCASACGVATDQ